MTPEEKQKLFDEWDRQRELLDAEWEWNLTRMKQRRERNVANGCDPESPCDDYYTCHWHREKRECSHGWWRRTFMEGACHTDGGMIG